MDSSRHVVAVLSPEFLKAGWPRCEWKKIVADDPNSKKGRLIARSLLISALVYFI